MNKFKVGDIVKGTIDTYTYTNTQMTRGEVIATYDSGIIRVKILEHSYQKLVGKEYTVNQKFFELADPKETIVIYRKGQEIIGILERDGEEVKRSAAQCSPEDTYNLETGARLVVERLFAPVRAYNGKVVCIKSSSIFFKKGKIYNVTDGLMDTERSKKYWGKGLADAPFSYFDEINEEFSVETQFVELVE